MEQAVKEDKQTGDIKTIIDEEIDDPAAEPKIMLLSMPEAASGSQDWPWALGPSEVRSAGLSTDEFKQHMHNIENKLHNAPIPERQPASI